jgi:hypothetical protein
MMITTTQGDTPKKRRVDQPGVNKKGKARAGSGDYEADDFIVEDEPSDAEEGAAPRVLISKPANQIFLIRSTVTLKIKRAADGRNPRANVNVDSTDVDIESEEMDVSEAGDKPETGAKPGSRAPVASALDDDDALPQASRKPGKKRIIMDDDDEMNFAVKIAGYAPGW